MSNMETFTSDKTDYYANLSHICVFVLLAVHYNLYKFDKDLAKYVKMHIDDGIEIIAKRFNQKIVSQARIILTRRKGINNI